MAFLRNLLATILGLFIFCFLGFIFIIGIAASMGTETKPTISSNSVLNLKLNGIVAEQVAEDPLADLFPNASVRMIGLMNILSAIEKAKSDDKIVGIYLEHQFISAGFASLKEIRDALIDFKTSGKFVYSYGEYMSEGDYYLASVADSIFLHPEGLLEFNGLSANVTFWKGLFDKLDIQPEVFRVGQFKSFVEPYQQKQMSDENRLQLTELLEDVYKTYIQEVSVSRNLEAAKLNQISDELWIQIPDDAVKFKLIDRLAYEDELLTVMADQIGVASAKDIKMVNETKYLNSTEDVYSKNKIAVIVAEGDIVMGGDESSIVGEKFAKEIREARESKSIKAIVLRINSPGGSLTASDMIWREIQLTKGVKPIIASMSDVAASGGYYIAMLCDTIVAQPTTITGSIGIFGLMFNLEKFLENKLGITHDVVKTGKYSDVMTVTRKLTPYERASIQRGVDKGYQTFITKAAAGRGVTPEDINKVGGGRVWTGNQALENGLVDVVGSFKDAVELAAASAGVSDDYRVGFYPVKKPFFEEVLSRLGEEASVRIFSGNELLAPYAKDINRLKNMQGIQVRMPGDITIQ